MKGTHILRRLPYGVDIANFHNRRLQALIWATKMSNIFANTSTGILIQESYHKSKKSNYWGVYTKVRVCEDVGKLYDSVRLILRHFLWLQGYLSNFQFIVNDRYTCDLGIISLLFHLFTLN